LHNEKVIVDTVKEFFQKHYEPYMSTFPVSGPSQSTATSKYAFMSRSSSQFGSHVRTYSPQPPLLSKKDHLFGLSAFYDSSPSTSAEAFAGLPLKNSQDPEPDSPPRKRQKRIDEEEETDTLMPVDNLKKEQAPTQHSKPNLKLSSSSLGDYSQVNITIFPK
jgi:hypothetical protein